MPTGLVALVCLGGLALAGERKPLGHGAQFVTRARCTCGGVAKKGIFAHPPWQGAKGRVVGQFDLALNDAKEPELVFFMGIQDGHGSDKGVIYRVLAADKELWSEWHKDATWRPVRVSLKDYAGKALKLELAVDSLGEHYANWGEPRVVDGDKVLYDLADLATQAAKFVDLMDAVPADQMPASIREARERERRESSLVRPTLQQLAWQELEFIAFAHFGVNTFTNREWGDGKEDPKLFHPTELDASQWVAVLKDAGIKLLILTAKHHDGFCLWPSQFTEHCVKNSPWRGGKGDVVREVADALRRGGLKFGVYLSPWDRHERTYGDSPVYNAYFKNQLTELLTSYGEVTEVWFDGACGEGPNGKRQVYDWPGFYAVVRQHQPKALIAICGPDVRWVGNESGVARETEWSVQPASPAIHGKTGLVWYPAECDVSIRPGWFYHPEQDEQVKSPDHLLDIYYQSVGRNSVLLLNIPPDRRGLLHENDAKRLRELRHVLDATFATNLARGKPAAASNVRGNDPAHGADKALDGDPATYWTTDDAVTSASLEVDLGAPVTFNLSMLQEHIALGQRVEAYAIEAWDGQAWRVIAQGTTIGHKKLDRFPDVTASRVRVTLRQARANPTLREVGLCRAPAPLP
jgi:alpha-L-fucosidase